MICQSNKCEKKMKNQINNIVCKPYFQIKFARNITSEWSQVAISVGDKEVGKKDLEKRRILLHQDYRGRSGRGGEKTNGLRQF